MLTAILAPTLGDDMLTASLEPPTFGAAMVTESLLLAAGLASLVEVSFVALILVTLTFLATARLLIRDFFSMDIGLAPQLFLIFCLLTSSYIAPRMPNWSWIGSGTTDLMESASYSDPCGFGHLASVNY